MKIFLRLNLKPSLFIILLLFIFTARAQTNFSVTYIGIEQGLSNNSVTSIYQDHYGFMWFGTYDGLNQYDGNHFKVFRNQPGDSTSLINNRIVAVTEDHDNNLWIATKNGISKLNQRTANFSSISYQPWKTNKTKKLIGAINDIGTDMKGDVFIATAGLGLMLYAKNADHAVQLPFRHNNTQKLSYHVQGIKFDKTGKAWLFLQGVGLCYYNFHKKCVEPVDTTIRSGTCILPDNAGHVWLGSENGLFQYTINSKKYTSFSHRLSNTTVVDLYLDKKQNLWIGTDGGGVNILNLTTDTMDKFLQGENKNSLKSGAVFAIYEDSNSRKWIGTLRGGVNIVDPQKNKFKNVSHNPLNQNSLINDFIIAFCEDEAHNLWIGTDGEGLSYWVRDQNKYFNFAHNASSNSLSNNNVTRIIKDYQNNIWISTYGGGVCLYNKKDHTFKRYSCYNTAYHYEDRNVWTLYEDTSHNLWAGTCTGGGLYRFNRTTDQFELFDVHVTNVLTLAQDKEDNLWAGTFSELIKIDQTHRNHEIHHINYPVRAIYEDDHNTLWVGTEGSGLHTVNLQTQELKRFTEENGLPNNSVLNILSDHSGFLWLSTYNGLSRLDPVKRSIKNFYVSDGLPSNQFNYNAAIRLTSNEFIFGGIKGFTIFSPDSIHDASGFPEIVLTDLLINHTSIEKDTTYTGKKNVNALEQITLPYDKAVLSLDFAALEYSAPDKISYAYFLEGWDNAWSPAGKVKTANYSKLREGTYRLRIKSTNLDNVWNKKERILQITVLPPWYRTWWAYGIYGFAVMLVFIFYSHYQSKQAHLKYEIKIAHIKAEKEKELNEKKLAFFTNISHEFRTPLTLIINPAKELLYSTNKEIGMQDVSIIYRNAKRLLSLVDQLLLFQKAETDDKLKIVRLNFANLCKEVFLCFVHQATSKKIHYEFNCLNDTIEIFADREKIEIALFNLISNALKFTPEGGTVKIDITESVDGVEFCITDSGCGIPVESGHLVFDKFFQVYSNKKTSKGGFGIGLHLVKKFVEDHKGEIILNSKINEGATFKIKLWKGREHFGEAFIFEDVEESSVFLEELVEDTLPEIKSNKKTPQQHTSLDDVLSDKKSMLIVDDNDQIRHYVRHLFTESFNVLEADNAEDAFKLVQESLPDIIICDVLMKGKSGIEFCSQIKEDPALNHIPVILLTASSSAEIKLKGLEGGADDYITKPFDKELLIARIAGILRSRNNLQKYFYNEVTLQSNNLTISQEYKEFLTKCIHIIENHLEDTDFNIKTFAAEMGMSHSNLYKKIKSISEQSATEFIRFIRLRKAAELMINTSMNVSEVAFKVGFNDIKYFREQFIKLFQIKPSEYIRKFRKTLQKNSYKFTENKSHEE